MNYNKVIKDLKERNNNLQEQYRLRDIRCIHLEYENEMLKSDFETQHELTKKYAEENQQLKESLHQASIGIQELIEQDIECPSNCSKLKELKKQLEEYDRKLFITKNELDMRQKSIDNKLNQQKEFIEMLEKEILDSKAGSSQQYYAKEHLSKYKSIIGDSNE